MESILKKNEKILINLIYIIFFFIGIYIYKDYGIGLEENFQRASGFYWLGYISEIFNLNNLKIIADIKLNQLYIANPNLPKVAENLAYGIIFDLPCSLLEIFFNFKNNNNNIYLRHFISFFIFFISSYCFTKLIKKRFNDIIITFFGTFVYFFSPKVFGASFFDGKDIFFLSIFTISNYYYFKFVNQNNRLNLIIFAIFASIAFSSRTPGLMFFTSFLMIYVLKFICVGNYKIYFNTLKIFIITYFLFLFFHWPYLWNFIENFKFSYGPLNIKVYFDGIFYSKQALPLNYIPKLIFVSTPLFIIFFFILGVLLVLKRLYLRLILVKDNSIKLYKFDLWRGKKEELDIFIFICLAQTIFIYYTFNKEIFSSWRHFYFFHFFLTYYFCYSIKYLFIVVENLKKIKILINIIVILFVSEMIYKLYKYHPYQNVYFNSTLTKEDKLKFERDTAQISRLEAVKNILNESKKEKKINIGVASWTPLGDISIFFNENELKNINFIGHDNLSDADFIYTNYLYEVNNYYANKYVIPENFYLYKSILKDETLIYSIYKKK